MLERSLPGSHTLERRGARGPAPDQTLSHARSELRRGGCALLAFVMSVIRARAAAALCLVWLAWASAASADEEPFAFLEVASPGRTAAAEIADFDGDGRADLLAVTFSGLPPVESRQVRVFYQREDGTLPAQPSWVGALPAGAAVYDLADLPGSPGTDLILLTRDGMSILSFAQRTVARRDVAIEGARLMAVASDERSLDRVKLARDGLGPRTRIVVPGFLQCAILETDGSVVSIVELSGRANYYTPPRPGPLISGSEIELHFDFPRLNHGDVNGDGRGDLIAADRHEVRIFLQRDDGTFPRHADRTLAVGLVTEADHIRSSGNLAIDAADFDGDGRVDLLISHSSGGLFKPHAETRLHLNHDGAFDMDTPDRVLVSEGAIATVEVLDLDGDGRVELIDARIPMGVLPLVEALLQRAIDADVFVYKVGADGRMGDDPWIERSISVPFNFDTNRPMGFFPDYHADIDGDGVSDLLMSGKGDVVEVYLGGDGRFEKRAASQKADTTGRLRFGDLNGDKLTDLLIYDPLRPDSPIRIGRNRATFSLDLRPTPSD